MKKDALIAELTMRPVIAAVRGQAEAEKAAKSPVAAVIRAHVPLAEGKINCRGNLLVCFKKNF